MASSTGIPHLTPKLRNAQAKSLLMVLLLENLILIIEISNVHILKFNVRIWYYLVSIWFIKELFFLKYIKINIYYILHVILLSAHIVFLKILPEYASLFLQYIFV